MKTKYVKTFEAYRLDEVKHNTRFGEWSVTREDEHSIKLVNQETMDDLYVHKDGSKFSASWKKLGVEDKSLKRVMDKIIKIDESLNESLKQDAENIIMKVFKHEKSGELEYDKLEDAVVMLTKGNPSQKKRDFIKETLIGMINDKKVKSHLATGNHKHPYYTLK